MSIRFAWAVLIARTPSSQGRARDRSLLRDPVSDIDWDVARLIARRGSEGKANSLDELFSTCLWMQTLASDAVERRRCGRTGLLRHINKKWSYFCTHQINRRWSVNSGASFLKIYHASARPIRKKKRCSNIIYTSWLYMFTARNSISTSVLSKSFP